MFQDHLFLINLLHFTIIYGLEDTWDYCIYMVEDYLLLPVVHLFPTLDSVVSIW